MRARLLRQTRRRCSLGWEPADTLNLHNRAFEFGLYSRAFPPIAGRATAEGFERFRRRNPDIPADFFNALEGGDGLHIGSVSLGTYKGDNSAADDQQFFNALADGVLMGAVNYIDTAINFRYQRSERAVRAALNYLFREKLLARDELIVGTRGGVVHEDGETMQSAAEVVAEAVRCGAAAAGDFFQQSCLRPAFLELQLAQSLRNLGVEAVDVYALMLPEIQLGRLDRPALLGALVDAAEMLEEKARRGTIGAYGLSSWSCFRVPESHRYHLGLEELLRAVERRLGPEHHFRFVYCPMSLAMPEAFVEKTQRVADRACTLLEAASALRLNVLATAPFFAGTLFHVPMSSVLFRANYQGAKHLNFLRSLDFPALKSVVMGAKNNRHLKTNLTVCYLPRMAKEDYREVLFESDLRRQAFETKIKDLAENQ